MRTLMIIGLSAGLALAAASGVWGGEVKGDLQKLQGVWQLISASQDGKPLAADKVKRTTILFKGDTFAFPDQAEQATSKAGTVKIDSSKRPKQMDAISTEGEVMLGIYQLHRKHYQVCFAPARRERPKEFSSRAGSGNILQVWQRKTLHEP